MFKSIVLLFILGVSAAHASVMNSYDFTQKRPYKFGACKEVENPKYPLATKLLSNAVDHIFYKNKNIFIENEIERKDLCIKVTDDYNVNAYVIPMKEHAGIIHFHIDQLKKDSRNYSTLVAVVAHEIAHILMNHHDGNLASDLEENEIFLQEEYVEIRNKRFEILESVNLILDKIANDENYLARNEFRKVKEAGLFSAWKFPEMNNDFVAKASNLNESEKQILRDHMFHEQFEIYNQNSKIMTALSLREETLKDALYKSYDERNGQHQLASYQEREADEIGFFLYKSIGLESTDYFTFPTKNIFSFFSSNKCEKYYSGMDLRDVSMGSPDHPSKCYREQNIMRFIEEYENDFSSIEIDRDFNKKHKKQLKLVLKEIEK